MVLTRIAPPRGRREVHSLPRLARVACICQTVCPGLDPQQEGAGCVTGRTEQQLRSTTPGNTNARFVSGAGQNPRQGGSPVREKALRRIGDGSTDAKSAHAIENRSLTVATRRPTSGVHPSDASQPPGPRDAWDARPRKACASGRRRTGGGQTCP